jgi:hypothetical protein
MFKFDRANLHVLERIGLRLACQYGLRLIVEGNGRTSWRITTARGDHLLTWRPASGWWTGAGPHAAERGNDSDVRAVFVSAKRLSSRSAAEPKLGRVVAGGTIETLS